MEILRCHKISGNREYASWSPPPKSADSMVFQFLPCGRRSYGGFGVFPRKCSTRTNLLTEPEYSWIRPLTCGKSFRFNTLLIKLSVPWRKRRKHLRSLLMHSSHQIFMVHCTNFSGLNGRFGRHFRLDSFWWDPEWRENAENFRADVNEFSAVLSYSWNQTFVSVEFVPRSDEHFQESREPSQDESGWTPKKSDSWDNRRLFFQTFGKLLKQPQLRSEAGMKIH